MTENNPWLAAKIYNSVKQFFVFDHEAQVDDFEASFLAYSQAIAKPCTRQEFYRHTCRLIASLNNGHTQFFDRTLHKEVSPLPFWARPINNQWVVRSKWTDAICPGDIVLKVGDYSVDEFFEANKVYIADSNERGKTVSLFGRPALFEGVESFTFETAGGQVKKVAIKDCKIQREDTEEFSYTEVAKGIWHLQLNSFARMDVSKNIIASIKQENMQALIVDVRSNGGGAAPMDLMSYLIDEPYYGYACKEPVHFSINKAYWDILKMVNKGNLPQLSGDDMKLLSCLANHGGVTHLYSAPDKIWPQDDTFKGKLAILAGPLTASAAEDFVLPFTQVEKTPVIGETTCGSTGQIAITQLGDGMELWVGARRAYFPDGSRFEGVGFTPDIEVIAGIDDIRQGRDPMLERAIAVLSGR